MKILIGADFMPGILSRNEIAHIIESLKKNGIKELFDDCDFRILNLETPITSSDQPILKCGKNQKTDKNSLEILKLLGVNLVATANNHIMDYGATGLQDTIENLISADIDYLGVGNNLDDARKPYYIIGDASQRIGVYNCCEHEFSIAGINSMGANPYDPLTVFDDIKAMKDSCDCIIVLYHGGKEYYPYPTPHLQKVCRRFISEGANLVIVQHTHCIGCEEKFKSGRIIYGQGNFCASASSVLLKPQSYLVIFDTERGNVEYVPITHNGFGLDIIKGSEAVGLYNEFLKKSDLVKNEVFIIEEFQQLVCEEMSNYCLPFSANKRIYSRILRKILGQKYIQKKISSYYTKERSTRMLNYVECETHRELFTEILRRRMNRI